MNPEGRRILLAELRRWLPTLTDEQAGAFTDAVAYLRSLTAPERREVLLTLQHAWLRILIERKTPS